MLGNKTFLLALLALLLASAIPSIRASDDDTCVPCEEEEDTCSSEDHHHHGYHKHDHSHDHQRHQRGAAPAAPSPPPPPPAEMSPAAESKILTFLEAMNNKLDRVEEAIALLRISTDAKKCDNTDVITAIKESQTALEHGQFSIENVLLKNREMFCDAKKCPSTKIIDPPEPIVDPPTDDTIRDCCAVQKTGKTEDGIYTVYPYEKNKTQAVQVYCDMTTKGGGWTVFQRREEVKGPTESFQKNWAAYEAGFGDKTQSFWLGLPHISALTEDNDQVLRYDMSDWKNGAKFAEYDTFHVAGASDLYRMTVSGYTGNAGDSFSVNNNNAFSTLEHDNDIYGGNCAQMYKGGWWYRACHYVNPNGLYVVNGVPSPYGTGINWYLFKGLSYSLKRIDMKVRSRRYPNGCSA